MRRVPVGIINGDEVIIVIRTVFISAGHGGGTVYTDAGALDLDDIDAISVVE